MKVGIKKNCKQEQFSQEVSFEVKVQNMFKSKKSAVPTNEVVPKSGTGDLKGPTPSSNWIIPGKLLTGSYPGMYRSDEDDIRDLLKAGTSCI